MTTPTPSQTEQTTPLPKLSFTTPTGMTAAELERHARHENLQQGLLRARALDGAQTPPAAGPRDLTGLDATMTTAQSSMAVAWYWSHPDWHAIRDIRQQVDDVLSRLNEQAAITPQAAIHAAKITTLAASLIARHAAKVSAHLDAGGCRDTPGWAAMRTLTLAAEDHAARASGLDSVKALDTPRLLIAHARQLSKALRRAEPGDPTPDLGLDDPNDPELESALSTSAKTDPELAEASQLMTALSELTERARRASHRLTLDIRLHGLVETAQLRGFEMISKIARTVMQRYDKQGLGTSGRRNIAAMIYHYAEQRLERMRGTLGTEQQRDIGHYETNPPERYMDTLFEESRTATQELRAKHITPQERTSAQIRFLLTQREIAAAGPHGDQDWGTQPRFPPSTYVAGMQTDTPVETRLALIDALRHRVENNPFHRDAHFLNKVADRFALEIAGPPTLTTEALAADLSANQIRTVAAHLVEKGTVPSPFVLSESTELNLTHAQAERALAVLQSFNVVGPHNGLKPRETLTPSLTHLLDQLYLLEQRLPHLLEMQKSDITISATSAPEARATEQPTVRPLPKAAATAPSEPEQKQASATPASNMPTEPVPAPAAPKLPRSDRFTGSRHPDNLGSRPTADLAAQSLTGQGFTALFEGQEDRIKEASQKLAAGTAARAAAHTEPAQAASVKPSPMGEGQQNAQQAQQTVGGGVR